MTPSADTSHSYDVVVIGAGAGGMSAAAHLVAAGRKVLLVEAQDRLGGRASSEEIDGFIINRGHRDRARWQLRADLRPAGCSSGRARTPAGHGLSH